MSEDSPSPRSEVTTSTPARAVCRAGSRPPLATLPSRAITLIQSRSYHAKRTAVREKGGKNNDLSAAHDRKSRFR